MILYDMVTEQNVFHPILFYHFKIVNGQVLFFFFFSLFFFWNLFFWSRKYRYYWLRFSRLNLGIIFHLCLLVPKKILQLRLGSWLALLLFPACTLKVSLILFKSTKDLYLAENMRVFCVGKFQALLLCCGRAKRFYSLGSRILKRLYLVK